MNSDLRSELDRLKYLVVLNVFHAVKWNLQYFYVVSLSSRDKYFYFLSYLRGTKTKNNSLQIEVLLRYLLNKYVLLHTNHKMLALYKRYNLCVNIDHKYQHPIVLIF